MRSCMWKCFCKVNKHFYLCSCVYVSNETTCFYSNRTVALEHVGHLLPQGPGFLHTETETPREFSSQSPSQPWCFWSPHQGPQSFLQVHRGFCVLGTSCKEESGVSGAPSFTDPAKGSESLNRLLYKPARHFQEGQGQVES